MSVDGVPGVARQSCGATNRYLFLGKWRIVRRYRTPLRIRPLTTQQALEDTLAKAEATLFRAVSALAAEGGDKASSDVEKARAACRDARSALVRQARRERDN